MTAATKSRGLRVVGLAARLRSLRLARGVTQGQLAAVAGMARTTLVMFESERSLPSLDSLCGLADALDVTTDELLGRMPALAAEMRSALELCDPDGGRLGILAPEDAEVRALCERIGYGAVMDSAARQWRLKDQLGAFTGGPCVATVRRALGRP